MMQKKLAAGLAVLLAAGMALSSCGERAQQEMILFPMLPEMRLRLLRKRKQRRTDVSRKPSRTRWQK